MSEDEQSDRNTVGNANKPKIEFSAEVIDFLDKHAQRGMFSCEAGGQLFARVDRSHWRVVSATGPRTNDMRSRLRFVMRRREAQLEIDQYFQQGLHYVGDWHTHPEGVPRPSKQDVRSMRKLLSTSEYELPGFLMLIVGNSGSASDWWLTLHSHGGGTTPIDLVASLDQ